jgi:ATP-dependent DNA helicase DinG
VTLPDWVTEVRPHQSDAVAAVMREFASGKKVVFMDAPTGAGKTLIAEMVRQEFGGNGLYVCTSHALQHQVSHDFPYAKVLKGRANYSMTLAEDHHADECDYEAGVDGKPPVECWGCDFSTCPYQTARGEARRSDLAILNTAYWLRENQGFSSGFKDRDLVIIDEGDTLEGELMGLIEVIISPQRLLSLRLEAPRKGSHWGTIVNWLNTQLIPGLSAQRNNQKDKRKRNALNDLIARVKVAAGAEGAEWVRGTDKGFVLKPIKVTEYGQERVWTRGKRFLVMSATIINAAQMAEDLGVRDGEWGSVIVPSTFPVANRPIYMTGIVNMRSKDPKPWEDRAREMGEACQAICWRHPDDRVLIHTVSHKLADAIAAEVRVYHPDRCVLRTKAGGGPVDRAAVLAEYRATPAAVLVAPGLERGVDLADDDCRVMIVAKVPYPNMGDPQVKARAYDGRAGQQWYQVETVRSLVQMTGRGVRTKDDWATSYILDAGIRDFAKRSSRLFPQWWAEAIDRTQPKSKLLGGDK